MSKRSDKNYKGTYAALGIALTALLVVSLGGVYYYRKADTAQTQLNNSYMRSFHDMADYLEDIDTELKKTLLATDGAALSSLSSKLNTQAEAAKNCLAQMPIENASFDNTSRFLSQVGDYTSYLSKKLIQSGEITEDEYENLEDLSGYAEAVNDEFSKMEDAIYNNSMTIESLSVSSPFTVYADGKSVKDGLTLIEEMPQEYPSLIYDGPFSEHLTSQEPLMLKGKKEVSKSTAKSIITIFLGGERAKDVNYESDGDGDIKTYLFTGGNVSIEVTKQGGMVLWMLDSREVTEENLTVEQAMDSGEMFLSQRGYPSMKCSFYDVSDNVATLNYAYSKDGVTMYPDLIKVKVALDNGEIVGFESLGYIMRHTDRVILQNTISEDEARNKVGTHLAVSGVSMAYVPLESGREVYCYEFSGDLGKNKFLIYINALTGDEEKILMIKKTERGILTI